jgi:hypothetical protein
MAYRCIVVVHWSCIKIFDVFGDLTDRQPSLFWVEPRTGVSAVALERLATLTVGVMELLVAITHICTAFPQGTLVPASPNTAYAMITWRIETWRKWKSRRRVYVVVKLRHHRSTTLNSAVIAVPVGTVIAVDATMHRTTLGAERIRSLEAAIAGQLTALASSAITHASVDSRLADYARVDRRPRLDIALSGRALSRRLHTFCLGMSAR